MKDEYAEQIANNLENIFAVLHDIRDELTDIKNELHKTRMNVRG